MIFLLSQKCHIDLQTRLRKELQTLDSSATYSVLFSDIDALPFLDIVVKEGLRLIPPVHSTLRVATEDSVIPTDEPVRFLDGSTASGIPVAKGTMVHVAVEAFSLNKQVWGDDAWEFR